MNNFKKIRACQLFLILNALLFLTAFGQGNGFGIELPIGIKSNDIINIMAPEIDTSLVTLVGMKKWPYKDNFYLAIICVSRSKTDFSTDSLFSNSQQCCNAGYGGVNESENPKIVYLSMIEYNSTLKLIASYTGPLDVKTSWENSNINSPVYDKESFLNPGNYDRFDFAKYSISDNQVAFGIRVGWRTMYAGGGGYFSALMLFTVQENKIINILSEPIEEEGMSAGEWNNDGTRDKNIWETKNIVIMLPAKTSDYYDLKIKQIDGKWSQIFKWNSKEIRYKAIHRPPSKTW